MSCIVGEIKVQNSKCFVTCVYRSPNQTADGIIVFLSAFEQGCYKIDLESPSCSILIYGLNLNRQDED